MRVYTFIIYCLLIFCLLGSLVISQENGTRDSASWLAKKLLPEPLATEIIFTNFTPTIAEIGDVTFAIEVKNIGVLPTPPLTPTIEGKGFTTFEVHSLAGLAPRETGWMEVEGELIETGTLLMTIRVDGKIFYRRVIVILPKEFPNSREKAELDKLKEATRKELDNELWQLESSAASLEKNLYERREDYDIESINLIALQNYLRDARYNLVSSNMQRANISIILARQELALQMERLIQAQPKSFVSKINNNILILSTVAGGLITIFAFYELLRKKHQHVTKKLKKKKKKD